MRCVDAVCTEKATDLCFYWGEAIPLCEEHANLIGNDDTRESP